jgi:hypothetical protein
MVGVVEGQTRWPRVTEASVACAIMRGYDGRCLKYMQESDYSMNVCDVTGWKTAASLRVPRGRHAREITGMGHGSRDAEEPGVGRALIVATDYRSSPFRNPSTDVSSVN